MGCTLDPPAVTVAPAVSDRRLDWCPVSDPTVGSRSMRRIGNYASLCLNEPTKDPLRSVVHAEAWVAGNRAISVRVAMTDVARSNCQHAAAGAPPVRTWC